MLIDQAYALALPQLKFHIADVIEHYSSLGRLKYVLNSLPPEFDLVEEMKDAMPRYEKFVDGSSVLAN
jgi:hypothetical protein